MILYNVTVKIDKSVEADWLQWMQEKHIPDVMNTGFFKDHKLCRILNEEPDGSTFAIQYTCPDMDALMEYQRNHAKALQSEHTERYKDRYVAIRTLMEILP